MSNANPEFAHLRNRFINVFSNDMTAPTKSQTVKPDQQIFIIPPDLVVPKDKRVRPTSH